MKESVLRPGFMKRFGLSFACLVMVCGLVLGLVSRVELQAQPKGTMFVFSQDGNALAIVGEDGRITVVDLASGEERVTLAGDFDGVVTDPAFSPDGKTLAGMARGLITLWDVTSGEERVTLDGDFQGVATDVAFSPDGKTLAGVVKKDSTIIVWDVDTGSQQLVLSSSTKINRIAFSPDGSLLASGGQDEQIKLWDMVSGYEYATLTVPDAVTDFVFSPVGMTLAIVDVDDNITLWDIELDYENQILSGHKGLIQGFAFNPDGTLLASGGEDGQVKLWDVKFSHEQSILTGDAAVNDVAFSPDGKTLASATDDMRVMLWDVSTGKLRHTLTGHADFVTTVAFRSDGRSLTSVGKDGEIIIWDIETGEQQLTGAPPPKANAAQAETQAESLQALGLATGDGSTQASVTPAAVESRIKPIKDNKKATKYKKKINKYKKKAKKYKKKGITALAINQDGTRFVSAGKDGKVRLWDAAGMVKERLSLKGHHGALVSGVAFSANGKRVFTVGRDSEVRSWDATNGKLAQELRGHCHPIRALAVSGDGKFLATGGEETRIMLWDAVTGKLKKVLSGHIDFINGLSFSADGTYLASAGADGRVVLWDVKAGTPIRTLLGHAGEVNVVAFDPKVRLIASAGQDTQVLVWDVDTGRQILTLAGHQAPIRTMAFSPDGQTLVSAGEDTRLLVWDLPSGSLRKAVAAGATDFMNALIFRANGKVLAGSDDGMITEWDIKSGRKLNIIKVPTEPSASRSEGDTVGDLAGLTSIGPNHVGRPTPEVGRISISGLFFNILGQFSDLLFPPASAAPLPDPDEGPGGPILVINSAASTFGNYYAEILRNEGFNAFTAADIATVTQATLANYDVVILAAFPLSTTQVTMLSDWVDAGGNLIAMRPDPQLAGLLGLTTVGSTLAEGYLLVDTSQSPGNGIVGQTIQFHGTADRYTLNGASSLATLYTDATTATANPALTLRTVGTNGGQAAAFAYDLATSIVYTRQGNPAWAEQERDGYSPIRSDDKFYGDATGDPQLDWVDLNKVAIPQADEQQRLLANLILRMNFDKMPLPRFWYFPRGEEAVVIMTGDDHGNGGTAGRFDQFSQLSPVGCSVADWECIRGTSYIYSDTPLTDAQAAAYTADGFEVGLHINTNCADFTPASLEAFYSQQVDAWTAKYSSIPPPLTQRHHCIAWSDWLTGAKVQLSYGIRLDTSYYFWPPGWVLNRPGFFTGSAMPMRFADLDGTLIDVYNAATQMTDESGQQYPFTIDTLLDRALGAEGYYGAFTINAHTDLAQIPESDAVVNSALSRGVPIVSSRQMMEWLDGRNSSSFGSLSWSGNALSFTVTPDTEANGLQAMVPTVSKAGVLTNITRDGGDVSFTTRVIKGIEYAFFSASAGAYVTTYEVDMNPPTVAATSPANGATGVSQGTTVTATFSEALDATTLTTATFELRDPGNTVVSSTVMYNAAAETAILTPAATLTPSTTYTATLKGGSTDPRIRDLSGNALAADFTWSFTTAAGPSCPCSGWSSSTTPTNPSESDPNAVELGVKFRSDLDGFITGIRFYKGTGNTGSHVGNLWTVTGQLLATAIFANETASGWQEVNFAGPIEITADTVYVASYHAPNGGYASDTDYFAGTGFQNGPLYFLRDGENAGNGVYVYSASTGFPTNTWQASNYWVDVVFLESQGSDTTPPTVTAVLPLDGSTNVDTGTEVTATFSEAMDASSITTTTFGLRDSADLLVTAVVAYNSATSTATLTPGSPLSNNLTYTAVVKGGAGGVADVAGNLLAADYTWSFTTAAASADTTPPTVTDFTIPSTVTTLTVVITSFSATDNVGITGYLVNESPAAPLATAGGWTATAPTSYTFTTEGSKTLYAWAKDAAGNVSTSLSASVTITLQAGGPEPAGWYAGDMHVHRSCGGSPIDLSTMYDNMDAQNLAVISLLADMGNGEVQDPVLDLPRVTGQDDPISTPGRIVHWDAEWHWDATYFQFPHQALGGHLVVLGLTQAYEIWEEYTYPIFEWAHQQNGIAGFAHMQYLDDGIPQSLDCCKPIEYPVEVALGSADFISEDVNGSDSFIQAYYRLLNTGFRPGFAAGTDFPCGVTEVGSLLTYVQVAGGEMTYRNWIEGIAQGRTVVSRNGHNEFLNLTVNNNATPGDEINLTGGGSVPVTIEWTAIQNLTGTIELVKNGVVVAGKQTSVAQGAPDSLSTTVDFANSGWLTARRMDSNGHQVHTAAVFVTVDGAPVRASAADAEFYVAWMDNLLAKTSPGGEWNSYFENNLAEAQARYQQAKAIYHQIALEAGGLPPSLTITTQSLPSSTLSVLYSTALAASGGTAPYMWSINSGSLPPGLSLDSGTGVISGTPTASGTFSFTVQAIDSSNPQQSDIKDLSITVFEQQSFTIWPATAVPATPADSDTSAVEVGVKLRSDLDGYITGIRFYKSSTNNGTHIGSLWTSGGQLLAQATFTNESTSGWQQVDFITPVEITANTVYVASYHAPNGRYAGDVGYFATAGVDNGPLHALQDGVSGGNGVYLYGAGGFPTGSWQASNYWVDVVFTTSIGPDTTSPTVTEFTVSATATTLTVAISSFTATDNVGVTGYLVNESSTAPSPTANGWSATTPTSYTFTTAGSKTLYAWAKDAVGNVSASMSASVTITLSDTTPPIVTAFTIPSTATTLTVSITSFTATDNGGVTGYMANESATVPSASAGGWTATAPTSYTFTTAGSKTLYAWAKDAVGNVSASMSASVSITLPDTTPPTIPGNLSAVSESTTQVSLTWTASTDNVGVTDYEVERCQGGGCTNFVLISTVTETSFGDSGLTAGTTYQYRVRATDAAGNLSDYSNMVTATTQVSDPPLTITTQSMPSSTLNVFYSTALAASGGTAPYMWSIDSGLLPPGLSLDSGTGVISGTPTASGTFSFTVQAIDSSNPQQTATKDLSITVVGQVTFTIWPDTALPATPADSDTAAVEIGVKFRSDLDGYITGIRFYKSSTNNGTHIGSLWTSGGQLLAQATFTNESTSGWQQVDFITPAEIIANTVYVASYHAPNGRYAGDVGYFATAGVDNGPLHALQDGVSGGNGVYLYGAGGFPNQTWNASNYWVDVVFQQ